MSEKADYNLSDLPSIPNAITATGFGLVVDGCRNINTVAGVSKIAAGRGLDVFDGWFARTLDQASDLGAALDATTDKIGLAAILGTAWHEEAVPRPVLAGIALRNGLNATATTVAGLRHPDEQFRPTKAGKLTMFADNVSVISYLYANAFEHELPDHEREQHILRKIGATAFVAGNVMGARALANYISRIK